MHPNSLSSGVAGSQLAALKEIQIKPEIGAKLLLQWNPYGSMYKVEGDPQVPGTYIEVEITAVKTAKLLLE